MFYFSPKFTIILKCIKFVHERELLNFRPYNVQALHVTVTLKLFHKIKKIKEFYLKCIVIMFNHVMINCFTVCKFGAKCSNEIKFLTKVRCRRQTHLRLKLNYIPKLKVKNHADIKLTNINLCWCYCLLGLLCV